MGDAFDVFRLKTRQYLGPVLTNHRKLATTIASFLAFVLFTLPMGVEFARPRADFPFPIDSESAAAFLSILLTFSFAQGLAAGIIAHPSEVDFVLTTPIRPRRYLVATYGFQLLLLDIFLLPFVAGLSGGIWIGTGEPMRALLVFATAAIFLLLPGLIAQSIGVLIGTDHRRIARGIVATATVVLLLPAFHFLVPFPLRYMDLPGPPELATEVVFGIARQGVLDGVALLGLLAYVGVAAGAWIALSGKEYFPGVRPSMVLSFGQPMDFSQIARLAAERKTRRTRLAVDVFTSKLATAMTKLQIAKWTRSSALPVGIMMLVLFGIMGLVFAPATRGGGGVTAFSFAFVPVLLPSLLVLPTFSSERDRLWVYTIVPGGMSKFFQALFVAQIVVAIPLVLIVPSIVMLLTASFSASVLAALAGASLGSSWTATMLLTKMDVPLETFSLRPLLFVAACGLGALPLSVPAVLLGYFFAGDFLGSVGWTVAYAVGLLAMGSLGFRRIGRAAESFVLDRAGQGMPTAASPAQKRAEVERACSVLAKASFAMILFASASLLPAIQPLWYRDTGPPPPLSPTVASITAVLNAGLALSPLAALALLSLGYHRLVHRAMGSLSPSAQESARIARRWFLTFWILIGLAIPLFFASIAATILAAPELVRMSLFLVFTVVPSGLLIALVLFLAYAVWAVLPSGRRTLLRRLVWADAILVLAAAAGTAVLTALAWHDMEAREVIAPVYSPWTTIPSGALNVVTLVALYLAFRRARRYPSLGQESAASLPVDPATGGIR